MKTADWGRAGSEFVADRWPRDEEGRAEESAFLCTCRDSQNRNKIGDMDDTLTVNMLEAYGIPCVRNYPGNGAFAHVIMGASGTGVDIFVPKSMLEEAKMLIEGVENDEEL